MTRIIDADYLLKELEEWQEDIDDAISGRQLGVTDAIVITCQMPTVDAIPVEWIENILTDMGHDSPYRPAIEWLLMTYRMERGEE